MDMYREAVISDDKRYRYTLYREWTTNIMEGVRVLNFIMLNPSTADAQIEDPTIRKCIGFAQRNGFNAIRVLNLFALRSTDPKRLMQEYCNGADIVGPSNDAYISELPREEKVVVAWGSTFKEKPWMKERKKAVTGLLNRSLLCVKHTGEPWHPLYVPYGSIVPVPLVAGEKDREIEEQDIEIDKLKRVVIKTLRSGDETTAHLRGELDEALPYLQYLISHATTDEGRQKVAKLVERIRSEEKKELKGR